MLLEICVEGYAIVAGAIWERIRLERALGYNIGKIVS
jgi:hypothetical protein